MINAVICEFNPFHNGHKYLIQKAKQKTKADATVAIMSGNFVQRGQAALWDKHTRAKWAIDGGCDLVLQIPTAHTLASAEVFASAGVSIAAALGLETSLCFGTEAQDISALFSLAKTDKYLLSKTFKELVKSGISPAAAATKAYAECSGADASILKSPNNLLAFEYIKAMQNCAANITPVNIMREGVLHDSNEPVNNFASASYIRQNIDKDMSEFMQNQLPVQIESQKLKELMLFEIYSKTPEQLLNYADITEGLENRFFEASRIAKSFDELCELVKSKRYTQARIRRCAVNIFLQNPKNLYKQAPPCLKVLAFNQKGRELLKTLSKTASLPIIIKPADCKNLDSPHFALEERASDFYDFCSYKKIGKGAEYLRSPIYVK